MEKVKENREIYFDYLRILSVFCVIGIHVACINWYTTPINNISFHIANFYDSLFRFSVPIFIMISGALFLDSKKEINIKKLYLKNILRLVIALLFWSLIYSIFENIIITQNISIQSLKKTISGFFNSHYHLWFLNILIGIYLMIPILKIISENKKAEEYFIILSFIFASFLPFISNISIINKILNTNIFNISIPLGINYTGYFLLGHYLNNYKLENKKEIAIYILGALSLIFTIIITSIISIYKGKPTDYFYNYLLPNIYFISTSIFILFKYHISKISILKKYNNIIIKLSNLTFGIYLIHDFFIIILKKANILFPSLISSTLTPLISLAIFLLSALVVLIISKIKLLNKYII